MEMLIGNSSSGILETASFELPTGNIRIRQQGRERASNVLDAPTEPLPSSLPFGPLVILIFALSSRA